MSDDSFFFWGMVVTMFMLIAAMLTARELFEIHYGDGEDDDSDQTAGSD